MAKKSLKIKCQRLKEHAKFKTRIYNRCNLCGRTRAYYRKFGLCRLCFRKLALNGEIPGVKKSSW